LDDDAALRDGRVGVSKSSGGRLDDPPGVSVGVVEMRVKTPEDMGFVAAVLPSCVAGSTCIRLSIS
jgi:hypothetical protein